MTPEARGERKRRSWHLAVATYRRLGEKTAYVHQRGFEPMQQEQMVLQYVEKHGSIGRGEVAELCPAEPAASLQVAETAGRTGKDPANLRFDQRGYGMDLRVNNRTVRETRHKSDKGDTG